MIELLAYIIAIAIPLLFLYLVWMLESYAFSRSRVMIAALGWGMCMFYTALVVHNALLSSGALTYNQVMHGLAPMLEETLKAVFLIGLVVTMRLGYAVDGAVYGFGVGTGFAVAENLFYITVSQQGTLSETVIRVFSVSLVHATTGALVGTAAGSTSFEGPRAYIPRTGLALLIAIVLHAAFNYAVTATGGLTLVAAGLGIGISGGAFLVLVINRSLFAEGQAIGAELGSMLSAGELAAAIQPQRVAQIVEAQRPFVGDKRAALIEQYVTLQARRGILRKTLRYNQRPRFNRLLQGELDLVERELDALRRSLGAYDWLWLRGVLPSEESELWTRLDAELETDNAVLQLLVRLNRRQATLAPDQVTRRTTLLRQSPLFRDLSAEDLEDLALLAREVGVEVGDDIIEQGEDNRYLYIVTSGTVVASLMDAGGGETIVTTYSSGDHFGELSMLGLRPHPHHLAAVETVLLLGISRDDLIALMYAKPPVAMALIAHLTDDLHRQADLLAWVRLTSDIGAPVEPIPGVSDEAPIRF
jgi:RsiW-degrading membrane proteinase PrsW (M82 family)